jgi:hypothetical protein
VGTLRQLRVVDKDSKLAAEVAVQLAKRWRICTISSRSQLSASGANIAGMNTFVVSLELSCVILRSIFCAVG